MSGFEPDYRLFDSQWSNIVNNPGVLNADSADDAVAEAVRLTEVAMAKNITNNNWPLRKPPK